MDSVEFSEWIAYDAICLPDPIRSDIRFGQIVQAIYNVNGDGKNKMTLDEAILDYDTTKKEQEEVSDEDVMQKLMHAFTNLKITKDK